jgi:hypothetical protein
MSLGAQNKNTGRDALSSATENESGSAKYENETGS